MELSHIRLLELTDQDSMDDIDYLLELQLSLACPVSTAWWNRNLQGVAGPLLGLHAL
jgi:hypothetical protein